MRRLAAVLALALLASPAMAKTKSAKEPRAGQFCSKAAVGSTTQDSKWYDSGMQGGQEEQAALDKEDSPATYARLEEPLSGYLLSATNEITGPPGMLLPRTAPGLARPTHPARAMHRG